MIKVGTRGKNFCLREYGQTDVQFFVKQKKKKVTERKRSHVIHPEKCFVESTKISIDPYLNEKIC